MELREETMRINGFAFYNFRSFGDFAVGVVKPQANDLTMYCIPNGCGKTNFQWAITWCLYREDLDPHLYATANLEMMSEFLEEGKETCTTRVSIFAVDGEDQYEFRRTAEFEILKNRQIDSRFQIYIRRKGEQDVCIEDPAEADRIVEQHFPSRYRQYAFPAEGLHVFSRSCDWNVKSEEEKTLLLENREDLSASVTTLFHVAAGWKTARNFSGMHIEIGKDLKIRLLDEQGNSRWGDLSQQEIETIQISCWLADCRLLKDVSFVCLDSPFSAVSMAERMLEPLMKDLMQLVLSKQVVLLLSQESYKMVEDAINKMQGHQSRG